MIGITDKEKLRLILQNLGFKQLPSSETNGIEMWNRNAIGGFSAMTFNLDVVTDYNTDPKKSGYQDNPKDILKYQNLNLDWDAELEKLLSIRHISVPAFQIYNLKDYKI